MTAKAMQTQELKSLVDSGAYKPDPAADRKCDAEPAWRQGAADRDARYVPARWS